MSKNTIFLAILVLSIPLYTAAKPASEGVKTKQTAKDTGELGLKAGFIRTDELSKDTRFFKLSLVYEQKLIHLARHILLTLPAEFYYRYGFVRLQTETSTDHTLGINFAKIKFQNYPDSQFKPYTRFGLERGKSELTNQAGTTVEYRNYFTVGGGIEWEIQRAISLDIYYIAKLDGIAYEKQLDETHAVLNFDLIKLF